MSDAIDTKHVQPNYTGVFLSLLVLTILEVFAANLQFGKPVIVTLLLCTAILKAVLVAMFYMHLKFEKILLTVLALAPLLFSIVLVVVIGCDIGYVRP